MSGKETMLKRISAASGDRSPAEIVELNLDNCKSNGEPEGLDENYTSLSKLSLINVGFTSLKNFPKLPKLSTLALSDNRIVGSLSCLKHCQQLTSLDLSGNNIKTIDALEPLASLTNLTSLDLFKCEVTECEEYRQKVFKLLPNLKYLDGYDCDGKEKVDDSDDEEDEDEEENGKENGEAAATSKSSNGEANNNDEEEDDDFDSGESEDDDEDGDDDESEEEIGLEYLTKDNIEDEEDDGDYEGEDDDDEDEDIPESDEEAEHDTSTGSTGGAARGVKRKHEGGDDDE